MFDRLLNGREPDPTEIEDLRAEIAEANRIHDYAQARALQKRLVKLERRASKGAPAVKSVERRDTTRRVCPFEALSEGGVMRRDAGHYQCAVELDDVNYIAAREAEQEDVRILWGDYLNSLDHNIEIHIYLDNHKVDDEAFLKSLKMAPVAGDPDGNALRAEFDAYCRDKLNGSSRAMRRTRTVVITVAAETREKAAPMLAREAERLIRTMRDLESDARALSGQEWLDRITAHTHPDDAEGVIDLREASASIGLTSRDLAAPSSLVRIGERPDDSRLLVAGRRWVHSYVMTLEGYGNSMRDTFITDLARLPYDINVSWHVRPWATDVAVSAAERHLREVTEENDAYKLSRSKPERGYFVDDDNLPSAMRDARDEAQAYRDDIVRNDERNFSVVTVVTVEARDEEELDEACRQVESVFSVHRKPKPDSWGKLREQMYTASLPLGVCELPYARTLTTDPLSHMVMWASAELMDDGGMIMGINPTTNAFETYDPALHEHTNSFTFGQTGSGKSMTAKLTRIIQVHLRHPEDDVIIIDPENEYSAVTEWLDGQVIDIHEGSADHINPLDISTYYGAENPGAMVDPVPAKVSFMQALVHMMASSITDTQKNLLDQAGRYVYAAWQQDKRPESIPTLRDVYDYLNAIEGEVAPDAHQLATLIKRYVVGTLNAFAHQTNVDIDNHLVDLVFSKISMELRPIAMLCILDHIWVRVTANRATGRRTWLIIDEFQLLLDDEYAVDQIDRYFTRGRKWNLYNLAITQSLSRMLDNQKTRYMLQVCPYVTIMNQTTEAAREAAEMFGLSDTQERLIHSAGPGQGLYVLKNAVVPFDLTIDRRVCPELYSLVTTRPSDVKRALPPRPADRTAATAPDETARLPRPRAQRAVEMNQAPAPGPSPAPAAERSWLDDGLDEPEGVAGAPATGPVAREGAPAAATRPDRQPEKPWEGFGTITERRGAGLEPEDARASASKSWLADEPEETPADLAEAGAGATEKQHAADGPAMEATDGERHAGHGGADGTAETKSADETRGPAPEGEPAEPEGGPGDEPAHEPEGADEKPEREDAGGDAPAPEPEEGIEEADATVEDQDPEPEEPKSETAGGDLLSSLNDMFEQQRAVIDGMLTGMHDDLARQSAEISDKIGEQDARIDQLEQMIADASRPADGTGRDEPAQEEPAAERQAPEEPQAEDEPGPSLPSEAGATRAQGARGFGSQRELFLALQMSRMRGAQSIDDIAGLAANDRGPGPSSGMIEPRARRWSPDDVFAGSARADG